ncbi:hypothetical protein [Lewinella cohaerens]|uniref:hypothetical protein n=1 Tax=Lewinella cohaerens TaxID=70995 RepID=UPI000369FD21|nr:hypothetical protein [Lewinella cohaerens]
MFTKLLRWLNQLASTAPAPTPTERSLPEQVRELLAQSEVPAALELLIDAGYTEAVPLKAQQEKASHQYKEKLIDEETFYVTNNRIVYAVLEMVESGKTTRVNTPAISTVEDPEEYLPKHFTEDECQQIRTHLLRNEYTEALKLASSYSQYGLLLFQRYEQAIRDSRLGLVRQEDHQRSVQQIINTIMGLVSPEEAKIPLSGGQKEQLILLMEEGCWPELLTLGGEWNDQMRLFSTQYDQVEKSFSRGLITKLSCENSLKSIQQQVEDLIKK